MTRQVSRHRSVSALLVDVPAGHAALLARALDDAGWSVRAVPVQGAEALTAALQRRGWQAVLYGGEGAAGRAVAQGARARPARRPAPARSSPSRRTCAPATCPPSCAGCPTACRASPTRPRCRRSSTASSSRRGCAAASAARTGCSPPSRRSPTTSPPGLEPVALCERVLATLGESLGWTAGAVWRPDGARLRLRDRLARRRRPRRRRRADQRDPRADLRRRPGPAGRRLGLPPPGLDRGVRRGRCAPAWSPPPRSRSPSATSASA